VRRSHGLGDRQNSVTVLKVLYQPKSKVDASLGTLSDLNRLLLHSGALKTGSLARGVMGAA
jgi:hypothetical protein